MGQESKIPRPFTEEEKQLLLKHKAEHEQRMQNDPEYRKFWEKQERDLQKFAFPHIED